MCTMRGEHFSYFSAYLRRCIAEYLSTNLLIFDNTCRLDGGATAQDDVKRLTVERIQSL